MNIGPRIGPAIGPAVGRFGSRGAAATTLTLSLADSVDPVITGGDAFAITADVNNTGSFVANNLSLAVTLDASLTYVSSSGTGWAIGVVGQVVTCTRATLNPGAAPTVTINVTTGASGVTASTSAACTCDNAPTVNDTETTTVQFVTRDATSLIVIPQTGAEWDAFIARCVTHGMTNPGRPDIWLKCQEASGNLADSGAGALTFTASGTGLSYHAAVAGWTNLAVVTSDNGTGQFRCTDTSLPDMSSGAMSFFGWAKVGTSGSTNRAMFTMGTTTIDYIGGQANTRVVSGANSATGGADTGVVRPYGLVGNKSGSHVEGYTDVSKVTPTSSASVTGKGVGIGAVGGVVTSIGCSVLFAFGWKSALAAADIKIMYQTAGWTVTWS